MRYCSLGHGCHSAAILQRLGIKIESYPFDWMNSRPGMIKDCIEDDFKKFLDRSYYSEIVNHWDDHDACQHDFYASYLQDVSNPEKQIIFRHRNPLVDDEAYAYYQRCVERFRKLLSSNEEKTFIIMYPNRSLDTTASMMDTLSLSNFLVKYTNNFKIIAVHGSVTGYRSHKITGGKNLKFIQLTTVTNDDGGNYTGQEDNQYLSEIIKKLL